MTRALFDTNVILDVLLDRQPWSADAKVLWQAHLNNQFAAHVTATSLTDIFYISCDFRDSKLSGESLC